MKIQMIKDCGVFKKGQQHDVAPHKANALLTRGFCVRVNNTNTNSNSNTNTDSNTNATSEPVASITGKTANGCEDSEPNEPNEPNETDKAKTTKKAQKKSVPDKARKADAV